MSTKQRPSLEEQLACLDRSQTQKLLENLVAKHPELIEDIDLEISLISNSALTKKTSNFANNSSIDTTPFKRQVRQILRDAVRFWEEGCEDDPLSEELLNIIQVAVDFSERGDTNNAIAILEVITSTCVEYWDDVADYGAENEEIVQDLNEAWCEAILSDEPTQEEKVDLKVSLERWQQEWDADFGLALEALDQGWSYSPLMEVLQGNITEQGAWDKEAPDYANDLALIRLKILEREERYQEYLFLAQAEGQTQQYLTMLAQLGRIEEAIAAAQTKTTSMDEAFALAKKLKEQDALPQALDIAQMGLKLPGSYHYDLGTWTSDLAEQLGDHQAALSAKVVAFQARPSFQDYQKIEDLAGENWAGIKQDLLNILYIHGAWGIEEAKVDIFLHEGLIDDAIATVADLSSYYSSIIRKVMDAAICHNPDWVIADARRRAETIMDAAKTEQYCYAVEWLKKVRLAYLESGRGSEWSNYRSQLMETHARKYKLMGLFKQRDME
ncbi:SWIM zinc finger domain-containing protein [Aetokthonos hydrillicola Thurmond2011]|jgi:uncharacterized Zn finger protein|uniref:SWIM zinc finger domain-containing protein n=1 Tax=Aetokthonos hydrillicola Thurmond2011 TaxID=2712845 RepID=A0AAP5IGA7_9CYAN|nr:SWIM zinc finger domain-containing protein [Aetokthonos hydrillicola]MBO3462810.1 SWIM zinc finger domain-containing protein [Aetokthonos hydrillicola CCALA 1050]MBW4591008.1 SWIM zinc finger domain-containing protein [Aetokthonos hydrillicola CCALA 1050]MDR9900322.1 SWIM zinc finger domain-containing protein [Aetokthonos hydrillicola Thurmond2011]